MVFSLFKMKRSAACYKASQRNKNFRRFAYKIGNVLCITPWYDFEKEDLKRPTLNKLCALAYCMGLGILLLIATAMKEEHERDDNIFEKLLSVFSSAISIFLTEFLIFESTFIKQQKWESFLRKLSMSQRMENCCDCKTITLFYVQCIVGHILFIGSFSYQAYIWYSMVGRGFIFTFVSLVVPEYYCFLYALLSSNVALVIKCLYQDLNMLLEKCVEQYCLRIQEGKTEEKLVKCILDIGKQYRYISELVDYYNKIFGWVTLLIFWHAIIQLLRCANFFLVFMAVFQFSWPIFLSVLSISTMNMAESVSIILSNEMASSAGQELTRLSHKLQEKFDVNSTSRKELFNLADIARSHKPKFTAANFFVINKRTILGIINIATTYLIVIIEFNSRIDERHFRNSTK